MLRARCFRTEAFINSPGPSGGKTHNHIHHILIDRRFHSDILDVRSFRGADCDADRYVVVAKVREILAVNKQKSRKFDVERFSLRQLSGLEVTKQYQIKMSKLWRT